MKKILFGLIFLSTTISYAADSVDVTFRYHVTGHTGISVPGEFNGWNNTAWPMTNIGGDLWIRTARLRVGGNPSPPPVGVPGAWQYKFYYTGASNWPNDPLNHHFNTRDNSNSFIIVKDPTIYHFLPNQRAPLVITGTPTISAYIFPKVGSVVDTSALSLDIDGTTYAGLGVFYDFSTKQLNFVSPSLPNGNHTAILTAGLTKDTVTFITQAGYVRFLNQFPITTWKASWTLNGIVEDSTATSLKIVRNSVDTFSVAVSNKSFSSSIPLVDGQNSLVALVDSAGAIKISSPVTIFRNVNHSPSAIISVVDSGSVMMLSASSSTDPDSGQSALLTYLWSVDSSNPEPITGINGSTLSEITFTKPSTPGEYYFSLIATDPDAHSDTTRNYFTIDGSGGVTSPTLASNPAWVKQGRMYLLFFKSATPQGTINAALPRLDYIKSMGYNVIWILPVMKNAYPIDNGPGPGYNIVDFYTVAPEYGTNADFKNFVQHAHDLGLKIILDVTPNHTSSQHPFVQSIRSFRQNSPYWGYYQHQLITNSNYHPNLSEAWTSDSLFVYYGGFSDALLNYNWSDIDARNYMIDVYKYWVKEMGLDGYRLDVYWGPARRTNNGNGGENEMGQPLRSALKHIKPDILLLGEDSGTGTGTENIYADRSGGVDAAYDWNLYFNAEQNFYVSGPRITALSDNILNGGGSSMGFLPGPNASYLRFLENQDEDRISYVYGSYTKTMPVSTVVELSVGMPLVYSGQEVGWGLGMSNYDQRRRGVINWNYGGQSLLQPHYQKLAQIRKQFASFWTQQQVKVATGNIFTLAYTRPLADLNGILLTNFDSNPQTSTITLSDASNVFFTGGVQNGLTYYASDVYNDNVYNVVFASGTTTLTVTLPAYGSAVLVLADTTYSLTLPPILDVREIPSTRPKEYVLEQNYPNPFNPTTNIEFAVPRFGLVTLVVYNILGQEIVTLVNDVKQPGRYTASWDASGVASGVYFYKLTTREFSSVRKMLLMR